LAINCLSQKTLQINKFRFNNFKKIELFNSDILEYKLIGEHHYRKNKIADLRDSMIIFTNDSIIGLSQIKSIKVRRHARLIKVLTTMLVYSGVGLILIDTFNNAINDDTPIVKEKIATISGSLVLSGLITSQLAIKRIKINKRNTLKIIDLDFK
jgi:hypothetical protein